MGQSAGQRPRALLGVRCRPGWVSSFGASLRTVQALPRVAHFARGQDPPARSAQLLWVVQHVPLGLTDAVWQASVPAGTPCHDLTHPTSLPLLLPLTSALAALLDLTLLVAAALQYCTAVQSDVSEAVCGYSLEPLSSETCVSEHSCGIVISHSWRLLSLIDVRRLRLWGPRL